MAWHTDSVAVIFVSGTARYTGFSVLHIHARGAIVCTGSGARIFTFRMAYAALFRVHLIDIRLAVTAIQTCSIEFDVLAFETLLWTGSPTSGRCAFRRANESVGLWNWGK